MTMTNDVQVLAERVQAVVSDRKLTARRMFGGITFLLDGNMLCCASRKGLMVRIGAAAEPRALESPHASPCLGTGRPMPGFVMIEPSGIVADDDLMRWIAMARAYVEKLPPKQDKNRPDPRSSSAVMKSTRTTKAKVKS